MLGKIIGLVNFFFALSYFVILLGSIFMLYGGGLLFNLLKILLPTIISIINIWLGIKLFRLEAKNSRIILLAILWMLLSAITIYGYLYFVDNFVD